MFIVHALYTVCLVCVLYEWFANGGSGSGDSEHGANVHHRKTYVTLHYTVYLVYNVQCTSPRVT